MTITQGDSQTGLSLTNIQNLGAGIENTQSANMNTNTVIAPVDTNQNVSNIALIQTWIPIFDGLSPVTPKYLIDSVERLTKDINIPDIQKIQLVISKIKGEPLSKIINNVDLIHSTQFQTFKAEFLDFFSESDSLLLRQLALDACKQKDDEDIKSYAVRLTQAARNFFGEIDIKNEETRRIYDQTRLARLIEGVLPSYKLQLLTKDVKTFEEAIKFIQLLQANRQLIDSQAICAIKTAQNIQTDHTQQLIQNLERQMNELKLQNQRLATQLEETENYPQSHHYNTETYQSNVHKSPHHMREVAIRHTSPVRRAYSRSTYYDTPHERNTETDQYHRQNQVERGRTPSRPFRNTRGYFRPRDDTIGRQAHFFSHRGRDYNNERHTPHMLGDDFNNRSRPIRGRGTPQVFRRGALN